MKYLTLIIMIVVSSVSCSTSKKTSKLTEEKLVITYSKGRCLGKCPVYDLYIYNNGRVLYNGFENVSKKGVHESTISLDTLKLIEHLMKTSLIDEKAKSYGRDLPYTMLKMNDKKLVYQSNHIEGNLLKINDLIEKIKKEI